MVTVEQYFTGIINTVFMILGLAETLLGCLLTNKYFRIEDFVDKIIWIVPSVVLFLGLCTTILAFMGCTGMAIENKICSISYFSLHLLIIVGELSLASFWLFRFGVFPCAECFVLTDQSFAAYDMNRSMRWTELQTEWDCCGSRGPYDYPKKPGSNATRSIVEVPNECCLTKTTIKVYQFVGTYFDRPCEAAYVKKSGCKEQIASHIRFDRWIIVGFCLGETFVKLLVLLLSFCIQFEEITEVIGWSPIGSRVWLKQAQASAVAVTATNP